MGWHSTIDITRSVALELYIKRKFGEITDKMLEEFLDHELYDHGYNALIVPDGSPNENGMLYLLKKEPTSTESADVERIDTLPLLRLLRDEGGRSAMLSRSHLQDVDITSEIVEEAERRGEVTLMGDGAHATVVLADAGRSALDNA